MQYFSFCMFVFISLLFVSSCSFFSSLLFCRQSHLLSSIRITKPSLTERIVLEIADICFLSCIQSYFSRFGVEQRKHNSFIHQVFLFLHRRDTERLWDNNTYNHLASSVCKYRKYGTIVQVTAHKMINGWMNQKRKEERKRKKPNCKTRNWKRQRNPVVISEVDLYRHSRVCQTRFAFEINAFSSSFCPILSYWIFNVEFFLCQFFQVRKSEFATDSTEKKMHATLHCTEEFLIEEKSTAMAQKWVKDKRNSRAKQSKAKRKPNKRNSKSSRKQNTWTLKETKAKPFHSQETNKQFESSEKC